MSSQRRIGKYQVEEVLAGGGMAEVFRCIREGAGGFKKTVVIKQILPAFARDKQFVTMFLDEARLAANLTHQNIVQIFEVDWDGDVPYIAMEYLRGLTLGELLEMERARNRLPLVLLCKVIAGACAGLHYAHNACDEQGNRLDIIHRDVTPENIMVTMEGIPKLLDFGIAKAQARQTVTEAGLLKGKIHYLSPEQLQSKTIDPRVDIYALGVSLYLGATGRYPYDGDTVGSIITATLNGQAPHPSELINDFPPELDRIIRWCLERDPARRCPDCLSLQEALENFLREGGFRASARDVSMWVQKIFDLKRGTTALIRVPNLVNHSRELESTASASPMSPRPGTRTVLGETDQEPDIGSSAGTKQEASEVDPADPVKVSETQAPLAVRSDSQAPYVVEFDVSGWTPSSGGAMIQPPAHPLSPARMTHPSANQPAKPPTFSTSTSPASPPATSSPLNRSRRKTVILVFIALVLLLILGIAGYLL